MIIPDTDRLSYRQILVGGLPTGMTGLDEAFAGFYELGCAPSEDMAQQLVSRAREHNYIPASAQADYATALLGEYRNYYRTRRSGQDATTKRETWQGIPREQIAWFPTLDERLCDGCEKCLEFCSHEVYTRRDCGTVAVAQPTRCVVGCDACARLCPHKAITFPPRSVFDGLKGKLA